MKSVVSRYLFLQRKYRRFEIKEKKEKRERDEERRVRMTTTMAPGHRRGSRADTWDEENGSHSLVRSVLGLGSNACRGAAAWPVLSKVPFALSILSMTDAALAAVSQASGAQRYR